MGDAIALAVRNLGDESVSAQELNASGDVLGAARLFGAGAGLGRIEVTSQGAVRESLDGMLAAEDGGNKGSWKAIKRKTATIRRAPGATQSTEFSFGPPSGLEI